MQDSQLLRSRLSSLPSPESKEHSTYFGYLLVELRNDASAEEEVDNTTYPPPTML